MQVSVCEYTPNVCQAVRDEVWEGSSQEKNMDCGGQVSVYSLHLKSGHRQKETIK